MGSIHNLIDIALHLDRHLNVWATDFGGWLYALLFAVVFAETGLVVWPFLPGDSLLFAVGSLAAASGSPINLWIVLPLLCVAANLGDLLNYRIGYGLGPAVFSKQDSRLLNRKHLLEAQKFYDKHGRKTIILARFVPIVRTFAPFVAGVGRMPFGRFILFSIGGGVFWVCTLTLAGYFFGQIPIVQKNFELVVLAIVFISVLPVIFHFIKSRGAAKHGGDALVEAGTMGEHSDDPN